MREAYFNWTNKVFFLNHKKYKNVRLVLSQSATAHSVVEQNKSNFYLIVFLILWNITAWPYLILNWPLTTSPSVCSEMLLLNRDYPSYINLIWSNIFFLQALTRTIEVEYVCRMVVLPVTSSVHRVATPAQHRSPLSHLNRNTA